MRDLICPGTSVLWYLVISKSYLNQPGCIEPTWIKGMGMTVTTFSKSRGNNFLVTNFPSTFLRRGNISMALDRRSEGNGMRERVRRSKTNVQSLAFGRGQSCTRELSSCGNGLSPGAMALGVPVGTPGALVPGGRSQLSGLSSRSQRYFFCVSL